MTHQECKDQLKILIIETLNLEDITPEDISDDMLLFDEDGLGLDSLDAVELVVMLEKHFDLAIEDSDQARTAFTSLNVLADYVMQAQQ